MAAAAERMGGGGDGGILVAIGFLMVVGGFWVDSFGCRYI